MSVSCSQISDTRLRCSLLQTAKQHITQSVNAYSRLRPAISPQGPFMLCCKQPTRILNTLATQLNKIQTNHPTPPYCRKTCLCAWHQRCYFLLAASRCIHYISIPLYNYSTLLFLLKNIFGDGTYGAFCMLP